MKAAVSIKGHLLACRAPRRRSTAAQHAPHGLVDIVKQEMCP